MLSALQLYGVEWVLVGCYRFFQNLVAAHLHFYNPTRHPACNLSVTTGVPSNLTVTSLGIGNLVVTAGIASLVAIQL